MYGVQDGRNFNIEKPIPGCLGRVVNLFDINTGVGGNRLLMDKPHRDGSPLSRSRSDVSRMSPLGDQIEDKVMVSELRRPYSNRKSNGTPIKMLVAQEMSKEVESKRNPPTLVAKLMGLDALPQQQSNSISRRGHSRGSSWSHSGISMDFLQQEHGFMDARTHELHQYPEQKGYRDVYEIWQQSGKTDYVQNISPQKERIKATKNEKKMDLVREKFIEAKRLSTDEKLRQSKQFKDAIDVLSSNKDLFLKFLQEPNSMFSQHLYNLQSIPPPDTKRITVLRPSKMTESNKFTGSGKRIEQQIKRTPLTGHLSGWEKNSPRFSPPPECCKFNGTPTQPTRIVVLKPSPGKPQDIKTVSSPPSSSLRMSNYEEFYGCLEDSEALESREVAKEITQQICENMSAHRRDETLLSSVFSNGYIGDESSFNKTEIEYSGGNLSDSEVMSPTSRHSWDYVNQFGSPYSTSSFSRASYSPESSVCREAKKRLSERWAMMASNGTSQEQRHVRRSSSTLGEMLALSDLKKSAESENGNIVKEQESRGSTSCLTSNWKKDDTIDSSPKTLLRSKSVPVTSTSGIRLSAETADHVKGKKDQLKDEVKERSVKSTFKGRVSSLFFSRNRKSSKEKSQLSYVEPQSAGGTAHSPREAGKDTSQCLNERDVVVEFSAGLQGSFGKAACEDPLNVGPKQAIILSKAGISGSKTLGPGSSNENQDQPSPISVLEPHFEEDDRLASLLSSDFKPDQRGIGPSVNSLKSNLIDKSPPIGSIARTLSWEDSAMETASSYPLKPSLAPLGAEEEEFECLSLVQTLLSAAGMDNGVHSDLFLSRWHSPDSPLDPSLRDKYVNLNDRDILHEGKRRQRRSFRKLVFDCVNAALVEMSGHGPCSGVHSKIDGSASSSSSSVLVDLVWAQMKEWISGEVRCCVLWGDDGGDNSSLIVERVVRREVVGGGDWREDLRLEMENIRKEIEGKLLEELVEEAVTELTGRV